MPHVVAFIVGVVGWLVAQSDIVHLLPHAVQSVMGPLSAVLGVIGIRKADPSSAVSQALDKLGSGWKTLVGCLLAAFGYLAENAAGLPPGVAKAVQDIGTVLMAVGLYHAKAGNVAVASKA